MCSAGRARRRRGRVCYGFGISLRATMEAVAHGGAATGTGAATGPKTPLANAGCFEDSFVGFAWFGLTGLGEVEALTFAEDAFACDGVRRPSHECAGSVV